MNHLIGGIFMATTYLYTLGIGLFFLFLSLILNGLNDLFHGLSFFDLSFDALPGFLPITPLEICAFLVGFGGMGYTLYTKTFLHLLFAMLCGALLCFLTKTLIAQLRKVDSSALTEADLIGVEAKVIVTIFEGSTGSVALNTKHGKISYPAQSAHLIREGTIVKVVDIQQHILIVSDDPAYFLSHHLMK